MGGSMSGSSETPSLQCYATPRFHLLAHEAGNEVGLSTSALLRLALIEYVERLGLRPGLAEELRKEGLSRRAYRSVAVTDPAQLHAPRREA
jgi:hypothetical protein